MKKRYWILSVLTFLIICAYLFNYFYQIERSRRIEEIVGHQKIHARMAVKNFHELFDKWNNVLFYLSNDNSIISMNDTGKREFKRLLEILKDEIKGITRTDSTGKIIYTVPLYSNSIGVDISHQKHMVKILTDHKPVTSDVFMAVQGFQVIAIHYPVFNHKKFAGTIAFLLDFEHITKSILDDIKIGETGYAWMISSEGKELYCPVPGHLGKSISETSKGFPELSKLADSMLQGKEGTGEYVYNKVLNKTKKIHKIVYFLPVHIKNTFWSLAVSCSEDEITASLTGFRNKLFFIFALIFLGGVIFSYYGLKAWRIVNESNLRRKAENTLMQERSHLRTLIDNLPSGVFIKDNNYRKIVANTIHITSVREHLRHLGVNPDLEILNKTDFDVFPKEIGSKFLIDDEKVIKLGAVILNQLESGIDPDGKNIWLLVSKVPIRDIYGSIIGLVGITTDITERKKIEEDLVLAKEKAEEADHLKTAFLNNISHEIRTPLNAIMGFSNLLNEEDIDKEKIRYYTNIINESGNQLLLIISDIVNIATIEAGQVKIHDSEVEINQLIYILFNQYLAKARLKNLELIYSSGLPDEDAKIITDNTKLIEILSNLINNALKFTKIGYVKYGYDLIQGELRFFVEDTGIGIKPEYQETIFNRFFQADSSLTQKNEGTGLGLSIAKAYIEVLGGKIWLTSVPGKGTTFYFTLPYRKLNSSQEY